MLARDWSVPRSEPQDATDQRSDDTRDGTSANTADHRPVAWIERVTRFGWLSKGFVFVVIGVLAVRIATESWSNGSQVQADQSGALRTVADQPLGPYLLLALALGLAVFSVWKLVQAVVAGSAGLDPLGIVKRIGWFGLGVFYGALAFAAVHLAYLRTDGDPTTGSSGNATGGSGRTTQPSHLTARILGAPGGRVLVIVVALVIVAIGVYHLRKGLTREFIDDIDTEDLDERQERWLGAFGLIGFVARALVLGVAGWFLAKAAVEFDPAEAVGLDGALRELATLTYGRIILGAVGVGLVVAGLYDMTVFRRQQIR